jgi:hypothetical protein
MLTIEKILKGGDIMKTVAQEQKAVVSGRIAKIGLSFALHAMEVENEQDAKDYKEAAQQAKAILTSMTGRELPEFKYTAVMALVDGIREDKDDEGKIFIPLDIIAVIDSIINL